MHDVESLASWAPFPDIGNAGNFLSSAHHLIAVVPNPRQTAIASDDFEQAELWRVSLSALADEKDTTRRR